VDPVSFPAANHTITLTMGEFIIPSPVGLSIYARDLPSGVTIDADGKSRIFNFASSESAQPTSATLHGLTLINGYAANGGAIFNRYNTLQITASKLSQNQADYVGGGICNNNCDLILTSSTLSQNQANYGGGICNASNSNLSLTSSIVGPNTASNAGPDIRNYSGTVTSIGPNLIVNSDIKLAPLGNYGGPTQTMPPLPDSPALDAAGSSTLSMSDQRGFPRFLGSAIDLGAVESNIILVDTTTDEDGTGSSTSLREAISTANATPGSFVHFDANVFTELNQRIALTHGEIAIPSPQGLIIYASDLPYGVTIDGQNSSRIFNIGSDTEPAQPTTAALYGLTLTNGYAQGASFPDDSGGAVYNHQNTLRIHMSTLSDNRANRGGGIFNHEGHLELNTSTLSQNLADIDGGGIFNFLADLDITASTISQNHAMAAIGGVFNNQSNLNLTSCIIGANTHQATPSPDIRIFSTSEVTATISVNGPNLISDDGFSGLPSGNGITVNPNIHLAPLGNYGGPTQTMPPLPNSPAIDAGGSSDLGFSEQRGFTRVVGAGLDLGAVEYQGASELPALVNATFELDSDDDGDANGLERAIGSDPFQADSSHPNKFRIVKNAGDDSISLSFGYTDDSTVLRLTRSIDLVNFDTVVAESGTDFTADTPVILLSDPNPPAGKAFYRLEAE
jgi:hypothetical protein